MGILADESARDGNFIGKEIFMENFILPVPEASLPAVSAMLLISTGIIKPNGIRIQFPH